jgi:hypothetical protein
VTVGLSRPGSGDEPPAEHSPESIRSLRLAVVAALASLLLASCGSSHHRADRPTTTAPIATTSTLPADQAAVAAAWRHYWDIYIAVGGEMHLPDARLAQVATGQELRTLGGAFLASASEGEVFRGTIDLDAKVLSVEGSTATLRDCYLSHILGYDAKSNQPRGPESGQRRLVTVTLVLDGGVWKVSGIRHEGDGCTGP